MIALLHNSFATGWLFTLLVSFAPPSCTEYIVVKVGGQVQYRTGSDTFHSLKIAERVMISRKENFRFAKDAWLQLCAPGCGLKYLKASYAEENGTLNELMRAVQRIYPINSSPKNTGRKGLEDLQLFFAASQDQDRPGWFFIIDRGEVVIDDPQFLQDNKHFFKLIYTYKDESIEKALPFSGNHLLLDRASIYRVNSQQITPSEATNMKLIYVDQLKELDQYICRFKPVFASSNELMADLTPMIQAIRTDVTSTELYNDYILPYVQFNYGQPNEELLKKILNQRLQLDIN